MTFKTKTFSQIIRDELEYWGEGRLSYSKLESEFVHMLDGWYDSEFYTPVCYFEKDNAIITVLQNEDNTFMIIRMFRGGGQWQVSLDTPNEPISVAELIHYSVDK